MIEISRDGRVARFMLNRPEKRNALNAETCRELLHAFERAEADSGVGAILIEGRGSSFCAGMDLAEVLSADQDSLVEIHEELFTVIDRARKPIVAAVQGAAFAGGMGLAANAHVIVAAPDAQFALTEVRIGLWPIIVFRSIVRALGERRATELSITARTMTAEEALHCGFVTHVSEDPQTDAFYIAKKLSEFSPAAMASGLENIVRTRGLSWQEAAPISREIRDRLMQSADFAEGVKAFLEKRRPEWPSKRTG